LSNELWIIIIFFLYQILNKIEPSEKGFEKRKNNYVKTFYCKYKSKYEDTINGVLKDTALKPLVYSIMIYEGFNRPKYARILEYFKLKIKKEATLGIMQVKTCDYINDKRSIELGIKLLEKILNNYRNLILNNKYNYSDDSDLIYDIIMKYNGRKYAEEVLSIYKFIYIKFYIDNKTSLIPDVILENVNKVVKKDLKKDEKKT
jgi:hypothetical protein